MTSVSPSRALEERPGDAVSALSQAKNYVRSRRIILVVACVARLLVIAQTLTKYPHQWIYSRGIEMGLVANGLIHGQGYSSPFGGGTGPTAFVAPGYPTIVAGIFLVLGSYSFASAIAIMLLNLLFNLATIWLIMQVAHEISGARCAILAGGVWAISIPLLFMPTIFWETSISACAMVGIVAFALHLRGRPTRWRWFAFGVTVAVIGLINPALLPAMGAVFTWAAWQGGGLRNHAPWLGLVAALVVFSVWPIRNALRFHAFIPLRTTVGFELWMANRPGARGFLDETVVPLYNKQELAGFKAQGELAYTQGKTEAAKAFIYAAPGRFAMLSVRRFFRFWTGTGNVNGSAFYVLHAVTTSVLGWLGLGMLYRRRSRALAILFALPMILFPLPYYITHAEFRYRINLDGLLTILAAYAVTQWIARSDEAATAR